ncbi:DNA primase [Candidatus Woesebacteria bacterium RBG_16_34_12]|uniref:DNA primase n=1 Tax=Candidatus Woesebacteria bacterium RBG_16_34_12 TaxID=1802480 RepID=A0A1F7XA92_9BACT|nr:MAG: DNA primase [Candidatus Woesebacteria bacterium RBG_16_34_12]
MTDEVEEVKQKTDIVSLIGEYIDLKKAGRNYKALCPFHSEKTPSFNVSPELQIFKCFGCNESGDAYSFLQKYEGMDFYEALRFLADKAQVKLSATNYQMRGEKERLYEINSLAARFYQYILLKHPLGKNALSYLKKIRYLNLNTIKTFQLGYSPETSDAIRKYLMVKKKYKLDDLIKVGILYSKPGFVVDRFSDRVVFPLFDHRENIVGFAGRTLPQKETKLAKYINTPETPIYHKSNLLYGLNLTKKEIKSKKEAVVVEGELDLISSWQVGIKNIVALKGSSFTEEQVRLLSRFSKRLILALDTDLAGNEAARKGIAQAELQGLEVYISNLKGFKDPDEMARKNPEAFRSAIASPIAVWDFIINSVYSKYKSDTGIGKANISRELVPLLADISDSIVQAHYAEVVARKLKVPVSAVIDQIIKVKKSKDEKSIKIDLSKKDDEKSRRKLLEERLIALSFRHNAKILLDKNIRSLLKSSLAKKLLLEFEKYSRKNTKFNALKFFQKLPSELKEGFSQAFIQEQSSLTEDFPKYKYSWESEENETSFQKEIDLVITEINLLKIKVKLKKISEKIRQFERKKQKTKLREEEQKFAKLSKKYSELKKESKNKIVIY